MAKNITPPEEVEELAPVDDAVVDVIPEAVDPAAGSPAAVKRSLGVKEPIEFKFKVIGRAAGMILTLFKAVERPDADAQFERLSKEGYYKDLQVVEASMKIEQPPQPKSSKKPAAKSEAPPIKSRPATAVSTAMAVKKATKAPTPAPAKKAAAVKATTKSATKPSVKAAKKKPLPAKKTAKAK